MKHNTSREEWTEDVLNSIQGMSRAQPGEGLYERVMLRAAQSPPVQAVAAHGRLWAAAAIVLLCLNAGAVAYTAQHRQVAAAGRQANPLQQEIQSGSVYNY